MDTLLRLSFIALWLLILWVLEGLYPLKINNRSHWPANLLLSAFLIPVNAIFVVVAQKTTLLCEEYNFGLFHWFELNTLFSGILCILFLDFWSAYFAHVLMHKITWLWRLHEVHHSENYVDVSTAFRHHPLEFIYRILFQISGLTILGAPFYFLVIYQTISTLNAQLEHANLKLPIKIDNVLSLVFVTPNFHKIHHSSNQYYTDSNYGNIFSLWDRLFKTVRVKKDLSDLDYGLGYSKEVLESKNKFFELLFGFLRILILFFIL